MHTNNAAAFEALRHRYSLIKQNNNIDKLWMRRCRNCRKKSKARWQYMVCLSVSLQFDWFICEWFVGVRCGAMQRAHPTEQNGNAAKRDTCSIDGGTQSSMIVRQNSTRNKHKQINKCTNNQKIEAAVLLPVAMQDINCIQSPILSPHNHSLSLSAFCCWCLFVIFFVCYFPWLFPMLACPVHDCICQSPFEDVPSVRRGPAQLAITMPPPSNEKQHINRRWRQKTNF